MTQRFRAIDHPLGKHGRAMRWFAHRDRPVIEPTRAFFSDVGIGKAIGLVPESVLQGDETVATFSHDVQKLTNVVRLELIAVEQQDLLRLVTHNLPG